MRNEMLAETTEFPEILRKSVNDGLKNTLGEAASQAVLINLGFTEHMEPVEIHTNLNSIFGAGALVLEKMILRELAGILSIVYEEREPFDFGLHVEDARKVWETLGKPEGESSK